MNRCLLILAILAAALVTAQSAVFPLKVSEDKRFLTGSDGQPFLIVGDTAWSLIAQLKEPEIKEYLDDRQKRGFTAIIVSLIEHKFADKAPAKIDGVQPFEGKGEFTKPVAAYFDYAHRAVAAAHERGLSVWLCPAYLGWTGNDEGFWQEIKAAGPAALRAYGKFVGRRFAGLPNIVWMPGGDFAVPEKERWAGEQLARGIREGGAQQIMTAHGGQTSAVETFGDQSWIAVDNVYRYDADLWRPLRAAYARNPVRPFVLLETAYEGEHKASAARIRRQAWWPVTTGACGQFFGNNPIWYFDGPGFTHSKSAADWRTALDLPGSRDMARMAAILKTVPWHQFVPDISDSIVTAGGGDGETKVTAARTADNKLAMLYIPSDGKKERRLTLDLHSLAAPVTVEWFNPAKNVDIRRRDVILPNAAGQALSTPGENGMGANDWVLLLRGP